jgi:hypothetical protein
MQNKELVPLKKVLGMDNEPRNEAGVIILFTLKMKDLGFSGVVKAQGKFPDCIARRRGKRLMIEFEYKSKHFVLHGHLKELKRKKCTIVCWEDNWQNPPRNISIISLSRELGLSNRVRLTHAQDKGDIRLLDKTRRKSMPWSMPAGTRKGDLLLVWRSGARQSKFQDILEALENATPKYGYSGWGKCRIIYHLRNPVTLQDIKNHNVLGRSPMVESAFFMGSNKELTPYWTWLYQLVVDRNPEIQRVLRGFAPGVFTI